MQNPIFNTILTEMRNAERRCREEARFEAWKKTPAGQEWQAEKEMKAKVENERIKKIQMENDLIARINKSL